MANKTEQRKILNKVGALNSLSSCSAKPKDVKSNQPSIDGFKKDTTKRLTENEKTAKVLNKARTAAGDATQFVLDIIKVIEGIGEIIQDINTFLVEEIPPIEIDIKNLLKKLLKEYLNCGSNPVIPQYLRYNGTGVDVELNKIDFFDIFRIDPLSEFGPIYYNDSNSGLNSTDLNTFLYSVIQDNGNTHEWQGNQQNPIIAFTFNQSGSAGVNTLNIKASQYYSNPANGKTLVDLINDFVDSIDLFSEDKIISNIIDTLYGSVSFSINKDFNQLISESEIDSILNNLIESDGEVDDSYFSFTTYESANIEELSKDRKNGIRKLVDCNNLESSISSTTILDGVNNIQTGSTFNEVKDSVTNLLLNSARESAENANEEDRQNIEFGFIEGMINNLAKSIIINTISPKVMVLLITTGKIVYGQNYSWEDAKQFLKDNKNLITPIIDQVKTKIINFLLAKALRLVRNKISDNKICDIAEKANNRKAQLLSLFGVSQEILRIISGLSR